MKNQNKNRVFALLLAFLMLPATAACANNETPEETQKVTSSESAVATEEADTRVYPDVPEDVNFTGNTFTFLVRGDGSWANADIDYDENSADVLLDAVYRRNRKIEDKYGITITQKSSESETDEAKRVVQGGDAIYDAIVGSMQACLCNLQQQGYLLPYSDLTYIDLEKPWWDATAARQLSIDNSLFMMPSDLTYVDKNATWSVLYSKDMVKDFGLDNPNDLVFNNEWTFEKFAEMCAAVSGDANGDGKTDTNDRFGHIGESFNNYAFLVGFGCHLVTKNDDDEPVIVMNQERTVSAYQEVSKLLSNKSESLMNYQCSGDDIFMDIFHPIFADSRALFYVTGINRVTVLREQVAQFGILPFPKYSADQEEYASAVSTWAACALGVLLTNQDTNYTSIILETLCAESRDTLLPAYYDVALKTKYSRDEESGVMLDIIFNHRVYDLGQLYNWGGIADIWGSLTSSGMSSRVVSAYKTAYPKALKAIQTTVAEFQKNNS